MPRIKAKKEEDHEFQARRQRIGRLHASKFFWHLIRISSAVNVLE